MKKSAAVLAVVLALVAGVLYFRDPLLSRVLPTLASSLGMSLKVEGVHLELTPLVFRFKRVDACWKGGEAHFERGKARISLLPFALREVVVERGVVKAVLSGGGGAFTLPSRLRRLKLESLAFSLEAPWGRIEMGDAQVLLGPNRYYIKGEVEGSFRGVKVGGRFSFAGERAGLEEARPRGGGWLEGAMVVAGRSLRGTLLVPFLSLEPEGPLLRARNVELTLPGLLDLKGDLSFEKGRWQVVAQGALSSLLPVRAFFPSLPRGLDGGFSFLGRVRWDGALKYRVEIRKGRLALRDLGMARSAKAAFEGELRGQGGRGELSISKLDLEHLELPWGEEKNWRGKGGLVWKRLGRKGVEASLVLTKKGGRIDLGFSSPSLALEGSRVRLSAEGIPLEWLARWRPMNALLRGGWSLKGKLSMRVTASFHGGKWQVVGKGIGDGLSITTPRDDEAEGLKLRGALASKDLFHGPWRVSVDLLGGQALYSYWFFDFGREPWHLQLQAVKRKGELCVTEASYSGLARLDFKGGVCLSSGGRGEVVLSGDGGKLYRELVEEPLGDENPFLKEITPRGEVGARIAFSWAGDWQGKGRVEWKGEVKGKGFSWGGELSLPLVYAPQGRERGRLEVKNLSLGPVELKGWETPLEAGPYTLRGVKGYRLSLWRGVVEWGPFSVEYRDAQKARLELDGLRFRRLEPPGTPLPMLVSGSFSKVEASRRGVFFRGDVRVKVAEGEVRIRHIRILNPFSPLMRVGCDLEFEHLNLEKLTSVTSFGRITGFIKGYVRNLVISHGQPESFDMRVETENVRGVRKRISLKAINSISIMGGGGPISLFLPFFKEFGYKYIGFSCTLRNDVFTLHGLKKKGNIEYIVERGGLTGVDVINRNPNNRISFHDMMERLERIRRGSHEEKG